MYVRHWYCIGWGVIKHFKLVIKRPFTENESESLAASGCLFWRWVQLMSLIKSISSAFFGLYNFNCLGSFAFMVVIAVSIFCKNNLMATRYDPRGTRQSAHAVESGIQKGSSFDTNCHSEQIVFTWLSFSPFTPAVTNGSQFSVSGIKCTVKKMYLLPSKLTVSE